MTRAPLPPEVARARNLVLAYGWNATSYQLLNPGLELWFSASGDAVAGYAQAGGRIVVAGAPVCSDSRLAAVVEELERAARARGQRVCYFGAGRRLERLLRDAPDAARVRIGAQPVWDPRRWPERVARHASLRAQLHRARNKQVRVAEWNAERAHEHPELRRVLGGWLAARGLPPMTFLVEPDTLGRVLDRRVFVAERGGIPLAFLLASPVPARTGWLVEQIVRGSAAPNGTSELLVDLAMRTLARDGARYVTLGLSPLSTRATDATAGDAPPPMWLRAVFGAVRAHGRRFYNFDGLDAFKAKLGPDEWEPIYAIARASCFRPGDLYAIAGAFGGGSAARFVARALVRAAHDDLRRLWRGARGVRPPRPAPARTPRARRHD